MAEKIYRGKRGANGETVVTVNEIVLELAPSLRLFPHSPCGFEWGYGGSGPAQLALALLFDAIKADWVALALHQKFKFELVARWQRNQNWELRQSQIVEWVLDQVETNEFKLARTDELDSKMLDQLATDNEWEESK